MINLSLRYYVKSKFEDSRRPKSAILTHVDAYNFDFSWIFPLFEDWKKKLIKVWAVNMAKTTLKFLQQELSTGGLRVPCEGEQDTSTTTTTTLIAATAAATTITIATTTSRYY